MTEISERLSSAIADRYVIERELGQGEMATVRVARRQARAQGCHPGRRPLNAPP
ncbi:MAG: hypothetical protein V3T28_00435 [Gemmatimonadales bacterium]